MKLGLHDNNVLKLIFGVDFLVFYQTWENLAKSRVRKKPGILIIINKVQNI